MPLIPVGEWLPDQAALGNRGSLVITNALPGATSYKPMPAFTVLTGALDARARGAIDVRDKDLNVYQFAGDAAKLYQLSSTTWSDVSKSGGYSTGSEEIWEMVRWKNQVLATNFTDSPQTMELGGVAFSDLTTDLRARRIAVVGDYVVMGNTYDSSSGVVPDRVRWSAFNDATDWTVSPSTGSDYQDLKKGPILKIFGGEYGVIFGSDSTWRMDWVGAPEFFDIKETIPGLGIIGPGAAARIGENIFALSNQGFVRIVNGNGFEPIGAGRVDEFVATDLDDDYLYRITSVADPTSGRIFWAYPGTGNTSGRPNKLVVYDRNLDRWALIEQDVDLLWRAGGVGFTLEQLDTFSASMEDLDASLDSSQWKGDGVVTLAAFNSEFKHGFFNGSGMSATIDTKESQLIAGHRAVLTAFRALVDGGSVTARVGTRNSQSEAVTWASSLSPTSTGRFTTRSNARYHRIRLSLSGAWTDAIGVLIDDEDVRSAGRRG